MNKYHKWLGRASTQLSEDFTKGKFHPQRESDVQCHLYHSFLCTRDGHEGLTSAHVVLSEFRVLASRKRFDLVIAKNTKGKLEPRLLLEMKKTRKDDLSPDKIERRVQKDAEKLRRYRKGLKDKGGNGKPNLILAIYFFFWARAGTASA